MFLLVPFLSLPSLLALEPIKLVEPVVDPQYLVPVSPNGRQAAAAIEKLLGTRWGYGTMIYTDSTGAAFVVSVWGKDHTESDREHALHNFVTLIEVSLHGDGDAIRAMPKKQIELPIDVELATAVQRAWAVMLLKTRYPTNRYLGGDGWQTEFSVWVSGAGAVFGQLWSPSNGLPKELMDLGFALADYCKSPEAERTKKREKLMRWLADFAERAQKSSPAEVR